MIPAGINPAETLLISAKAQASDVLQVNIMVNVSSNTIVETVVFITVCEKEKKEKKGTMKTRDSI